MRLLRFFVSTRVVLARYHPDAEVTVTEGGDFFDDASSELRHSFLVVERHPPRVGGEDLYGGVVMHLVLAQRRRCFGVDILRAEFVGTHGVNQRFEHDRSDAIGVVIEVKGFPTYGPWFDSYSQIKHVVFPRDLMMVLRISEKGTE